MNLEGKILKILSHEEILEKDDLIRILIETKEEGGFDSTYKEEGYNFLEWHTTEEVINGWIGKKISKYRYHTWYEYARIIKL